MTLSFSLLLVMAVSQFKQKTVRKRESTIDIHVYFAAGAMISCAIGFFIAMYVKTVKGRMHFATLHAKLGLVSFVLLLVNWVLGEKARDYGDGRNHRRLGIIVVICGMTTLGFGLYYYVARIGIWIVLLGLFALVVQCFIVVLKLCKFSK